MTKKHHNWTTGPNQKVVVDLTTLAYQHAICGCNHLTPATEAAMENLVERAAAKADERDPKLVAVPPREQVIGRNEPGYDPAPVVILEPSPEELADLPASDALDTATPSRAALRRIEAETRVTR